jgi:phage gpG-like protein
MVNRVGFQVTGLREKVKDLQELGLEVDDLKDAFGEVAKQGAETAQGFVPRRTGRLAASIRGNRAKNKAVVVAGRASVPYAGAINYGWKSRNIQPALFMQRTDQRMRPEAEKILDTEIDRKIREKGLS